MDYIISDTQLAEVLDLLAAVFCLLPFFLLFLTKNIRLCDQDKLNERILKASPCMAEGSHDLSRSDDPVHVFCVKAVQAFLA